MPFLLDAGVPAPHRIIGFLGLDGGAQVAAPAFHETARHEPAWRETASTAIAVGRDGVARLRSGGPPPRFGDAVPPQAGNAAPQDSPRGGVDPGAVIRRALHAAGLLRAP